VRPRRLPPGNTYIQAFHLANKPDQAEAAYNSVYAEEGDGEDFNKLKEQAICKLGELFANSKRVNDIQKLMISIRCDFVVMHSILIS